MNVTRSVSFQIRPLDIVSQEFFDLFRRRGNQVYTLVVFAGILAYLIYKHDVDTLDEFTVAFGASAVGAFAALLVGFAFNIGAYFVLRRADDGVLCQHVLSLEPEGLRESTHANDSFHMWNSIRSVERSPQFIIIWLNEKMMFPIPRRAFPSDEAFCEFYDQADLLWRDARLKAV